MKTNKLTGMCLDWAVARATGRFKGDTFLYFTSDWRDGGWIIESEKISIEYMAGAGDAGADVWVATRIEHPAISEEQGSTPLEAAMRCYVACKLGDEVEIPDELKGE